MARASLTKVLIVVMLSQIILPEIKAKEEAGSEHNQETIPVVTVEAQQKMKNFWPNVEQLAQIKALELVMNGDDDHYNVDLDKLNEADRYDIVASPVRNSEAALGRGRLFSRVNNLNRASELLRNQLESKRNLRQWSASKEDKDYTFVGLPFNKYLGQQQLQQQRAVRWAAQKLRDMMSNDQTFRYALNNNGPNDMKLSQANLHLFGDSSPTSDVENLNELLSKNREKRRRCKIDPNLGVKNPSFCDTDAYFGAADYSMRDVWDSAGR